MRAYIIVDLGFGDAGKGLLTDALVRRLGAGLVVRYNGGAQAGHHVVTDDGRQHTFSQFGSGTFVPNVRTFLSRHVVVHPAALLAEGDLLCSRGVPDAFTRLRVSEQALVITPFHQAANRIREMRRGTGRHGSCGVGVGEAVEDALSHPEGRILAGDLAYPAGLYRKLQRLREQKRVQMAALCGAIAPGSALAREFEIFEGGDVIETWLASIARLHALGLVASDEVLERWLHETDTAIFEGAQGVLLDAEAGFHPYTTWSDCTTKNALGLIADLAPGAQAFRIGVLRCYAVRHGPGPLPTETEEFSPAITEHNCCNEWQGKVRYGWFDAVLARYGLETTAGVDAFALTHLDVLPRLDAWKTCSGYRDPMADGTLPVDGLLAKLRAQRSYSLSERAGLTQALGRLRPILETCSNDEGTVIGKVEALIGRSVDLVARGSRAGDVQLLNPLPG